MPIIYKSSSELTSQTTRKFVTLTIKNLEDRFNTLYDIPRGRLLTESFALLVELSQDAGTLYRKEVFTQIGPLSVDGDKKTLLPYIELGMVLSRHDKKFDDALLAELIKWKELYVHDKTIVVWLDGIMHISNDGRRTDEYVTMCSYFTRVLSGDAEILNGSLEDFKDAARVRLALFTSGLTLYTSVLAYPAWKIVKLCIELMVIISALLARWTTSGMQPPVPNNPNADG
jgi:hypothetical protein